MGGLFNLNFVIFTGKQLTSLFSYLPFEQYTLPAVDLSFVLFNLPLQSCSTFVTSLARKIKPIISMLGKKSSQKILLGASAVIPRIQLYQSSRLARNIQPLQCVLQGYPAQISLLVLGVRSIVSPRKISRWSSSTAVQQYI